MFVIVNGIDLAGPESESRLFGEEPILCSVHVWWSEVSPSLDDDVRGPVPNAGFNI